jgi:hypothetical protein
MKKFIPQQNIHNKKGRLTFETAPFSNQKAIKNVCYACIHAPNKLPVTVLLTNFFNEDIICVFGQHLQISLGRGPFSA